MTSTPPPPSTPPSTPPSAPAPTATYRVQVRPEFGFDQVAGLADQLRLLGVSHVYLSPVLQPGPGSQHGYDVVDHNRLNTEAGGLPAFGRMSRTLAGAGLSVIADVVPNHMSVPTPVRLNAALWSVLRDGPGSPYVRWFDVDWSAPSRTVLMPVLGDRIGTVLARGDLSVDRSGPEPVLRYFDHEFPIRPGTQDLPLRDLVDRQWYRLAWWRVADEELNYRRFFDVDTLAAVRVEDPEVFTATHRLLAGLVADGLLTGLRIDHPDGLADPRQYLRRLADLTGGTWVVVEKILEDDEELPADWPCAGTTGYDALARIGGLFVDPACAAPLSALLTEVTGDSPDFAGVVEDAKRQMVEQGLYAEVHRLVELLVAICADDIALRDHTRRQLRSAVVELLVAFDRYRAYVVPGEPAPAGAVAAVEAAAETARCHLPEEAGEALDLVRDLVLDRQVGSPTSTGTRAGSRADRADPTDRGDDRPHDPAGDRTDHADDRTDRADDGADRTGSDPTGPVDSRATPRDLRHEFVIRFQQTCGPVMAKGVEDTAFYRWHRLVALNEVGGDPQVVGVPPEGFHAFARRLQRDWPTTMTTLSTHDTKRSEDVRARLYALTELTDPWAEAVRGWTETAGRYRSSDGWPDPATVYLIWQTLVGTWTPAGPLSADRLGPYLTKATREAKRYTSWTRPDPVYDEAVQAFARHVLTDRELIGRLGAFCAELAGPARVAVLGQKLVQLAMPGVPDVYQGCELVDLSLVDPDNRRAVDFAERRHRLERLDAGGAPADLDDEKLLVTAGTLRLRRDHPEWFVGPGAFYRPMPTTTGNAVAFGRGERGAGGDGTGRVSVIAVCTRLPVALARHGGWGEHTLTVPDGDWVDRFTGRPVPGGSTPLAELLTPLPVALLARV